jgi:predicted hydrocarbon binding protein
MTLLLDPRSVARFEAGPGLNWPNKMGRMLLLALEDVMSRNGVNAVLALAQLEHRVNHYPPDNLERGFGFVELSTIMQCIEEMYGPHGGRSLALRAGRAGFKYALREFGTLLGLDDLALRLLPLELRLWMALNAMADVFNQYSDQRVRVTKQGPYVEYRIERCPVCWGRHTTGPCCYAATGLLQEMTTWVGRGTSCDVREVACIAAGAPACTFLVGPYLEVQAGL